MAKWFPGRRLSWFRLGILLSIVAALAAGAVFSIGWWQDHRIAAERTPWFDGYVDVTATPNYAFEQPLEGTGRNVSLAFVVARTGAAADPCEPSWGGVYSLDDAESLLDLDRRIARLRTLGGSAMVSFGGQANEDLAMRCESPEDLLDGYERVVKRYDLGSIDMDVEGDLLDDRAAVKRQATAIARLQQLRQAEGGLDVWLTLPVTPHGLDQRGVNAVRAYLEAGVVMAGVNAMTMNYGDDSDEPLISRITGSLDGVHGQLRALYQELGISIGDATAWSRIAATPMIGQNDVRDEVLGIDDARKLAAFANERGMVRLSMWSLNRDHQCDANWPDVRMVSDSCSGVEQGAETFAAVLGAARNGAISQVADHNDEPARSPDEIVDDPETSPYPIWNAEAAYPSGTKIVWRQNVYEAQWWTEGEQPDLPAVDGAQPWRLIGPVLPGETAVERPQLPEGTYPSWEVGTVYTQGTRVMFDGSAYEARWWTQGDSPDRALVVPQDSPWRLLTDSEIRKILDDSATEATATP